MATLPIQFAQLVADAVAIEGKHSIAAELVLTGSRERK